MGIGTSYKGAFVLDKPLQPVQCWYLQRFNESGHIARIEERVERIPDPLRVAVGLPVGPDGAYFVGETDHLMYDSHPLLKASKPPRGQPWGHCVWVPSGNGKRIVHDGTEKYFSDWEWLYYLIEHFLRPWSYSLSGQVQWEYFEPGQRGTLTIENNKIQGFDGTQFERYLAAMQRVHTTNTDNPPSHRARMTYEGAFVLDQPLEPKHQQYLQRFSENRRVTWVEEQVERVVDSLRVAVGLPIGPDGAYFVGKASVGRVSDSLMDGTERFIKEYNRPAHGQPGLWCDWKPSEDGKRVVHNGAQKTLYSKEWLYYLIEHFLRPWGYSLSGQVRWERFEFEQEQRGTIAIGDNAIQNFDVPRFERDVAGMQRGDMDMPSQQILDEQERIDRLRKVLDNLTEEHPF